MEVKFHPDFYNDMDRLFAWRYAPLRWAQFVWRTPRELKWLWQRMTRGWADSDVWGMNSHLARVIPEMLLHLKENKMGSPAFIFADFMMADDIGHEKWSSMLQEMADGFKAYEELHELDPNDFPTKEALLAKEEEIEAKRKKGMGLFVEHFHSLWD